MPNKTNAEIRQAIQIIIEENLPSISLWLKQVGEENPEKALTIIARYAEFILPKVQRAEVLSEQKE